MAKRIKSSTKKPARITEAPLHARVKQGPSKSRRAGSVSNRGGKRRHAPNVNARQPQDATFEEAKSAAVDTLIQTIEEAERRLSAVKQAHSFDELSKLSVARCD